mgnify:CR=1 FL=1|tara:strand:+ start:40 stop:240 length:201 start_codon:yes stop_codon:yes gene_type:complete
MSKNKLTKKESDKIKIEIGNLKKNILNLRFQKATGQLEKTSEIKKARRKIARLKTDISSINGETNA